MGRVIGQDLSILEPRHFRGRATAGRAASSDHGSLLHIMHSTVVDKEQVREGLEGQLASRESWEGKILLDVFYIILFNP